MDNVNRYYTKEHEWVTVDGDIVTLGISEYAQEQLGELTFVELPAVGRDVAVGGETAAIESSKAASDVYSPFAGKITAVNQALEDSPELIAEDCYNTGWICKIQVTDSDLSGLMDQQEYDQYLEGL